MSALTAAQATMTSTDGHDAAERVAAAVEDYRQLLPAAQRERLLAVCLEALDADSAPDGDVERLAGDLLAALCPDVAAGVRDTLAWICGDVAGH